MVILLVEEINESPVRGNESVKSPCFTRAQIRRKTKANDSSYRITDKDTDDKVNTPNGAHTQVKFIN